LVTGFQQDAARVCDSGVVLGRRGVRCHMQHVAPFEVPLVIDTINAQEGLSSVGHEIRLVGLALAEGQSDLVRCPYVVLALFAFGVRILGAVEAAGGVGHVTEDVIEGLFTDLAEMRASGQLPGVQVGSGQLSVVVEHFLEVRDQPGFIGGVAVKAATEVVVDTTAGHGCECLRRRGCGGSFSRAGGVVQQELDDHGLREFGRITPPAVQAVPTGDQVGCGAGEGVRVQDDGPVGLRLACVALGGCRSRGAAQPFRGLRCILQQSLLLLFPHLGQDLQHLCK